MQRLFTEHTLEEGAEVPASGAQAHYLVHVLRLAPGAKLALFNGRDGEWLARLATLHRHQARLVAEVLLRPQASGPDLWLAFCPVRRDATELVVRQATELGVAALLPVVSERTQGGRLNTDRLLLILREAAEQCERLDVPELRPAVALAALLDGWPAARVLAAAIERSGPASVPDARSLLVGPEGGFAPRELDALRAASFVRPVSLGPRILRAETACAAGLAILQAGAWSIS